LPHGHHKPSGFLTICSGDDHCESDRQMIPSGPRYLPGTGEPGYVLAIFLGTHRGKMLSPAHPVGSLAGNRPVAVTAACLPGPADPSTSSPFGPGTAGATSSGAPSRWCRRSWPAGSRPGLPPGRGTRTAVHPPYRRTSASPPSTGIPRTVAPPSRTRSLAHGAKTWAV
jgi:hypothetical protein